MELSIKTRMEHGSCYYVNSTEYLACTIQQRRIMQFYNLTVRRYLQELHTRTQFFWKVNLLSGISKYGLSHDFTSTFYLKNIISEAYFSKLACTFADFFIKFYLLGKKTNNCSLTKWTPIWRKQGFQHTYHAQKRFYNFIFVRVDLTDNLLLVIFDPFFLFRQCPCFPAEASLLSPTRSLH